MKLKLYHKIDAKHAKNIGEESVSNKEQAVTELVKNSRDADATTCTIRFVGYKTEDDRMIYDKIVFEDDGIGMTVDDFETKYFWIGTDFKVRETISPVFKRRVVGSKGMGHFSAQRLGEICTIVSNPWNYKERQYSESVDKTVTVTVDWREFKTGMEFGAIPSEGEVTEREQQDGHGLRLELTELKDEWTEAEINNVTKSLGLMQIPKALLGKEDHPFNIRVEADGLDLNEEIMDTSILDAAAYKLEAKLKSGRRYWTIYSRKRTSSGLTWERVKSSMDDTPGGESVDNPACGNASFEFYHFNVKPQSFFNLPIQRKAVKDFLDNWSGIKIFKDNVRMNPYGEKGHTLYDWVELQRRQRFFRTNIVGFVWLNSKDNPDITEVTSRQAVTENDAFLSMKDELVFESVTTLANFEKQKIKEKKEREKQTQWQNTSQLALKKVEEQIRGMTDIDPEDKQMVVSELKKVSKQIDEMKRESDEDYEELIVALDQYRPLATLGLSSLHFDHEVAPKLTSMKMNLTSLDQMLKEGNYDDAEEILTDAIKQVSAVQGWGNYIEIFGKYLSGAKARKAKEKLSMKELIEELKKSLKYLLVATPTGDEKSVDIDVQTVGLGSDVWSVYSNGAALAAIFSALMSNSIKSLRESGRKNPIIKIQVWKEHSQTLIEFHDNGVGIKDEYKEKIFNSFRSFFPAKRKGMGLGMTITKEIVEEQLHGDIKLDKTKFEDDYPGKGFATFLISIPDKELRE